VVTICTASLTFNNSTFCPHTVFMSFVWISEQTAIISLYNINWLVYINKTQCVYCAVRTGSLNTHFSLTALGRRPTIHHPDRYRLRFPTLNLASSQPLPEGRAGTIWETSQHYIFLVSKSNNKFRASHCTPYFLSISFHRCCTLVFIHTLLFSRGQTGQAWEPSKQHWSFAN